MATVCICTVARALLMEAVYNVIFDERLRPEQTSPAADYDAGAPLNIGRPVTADDMTSFFVDFM